MTFKLNLIFLNMFFTKQKHVIAKKYIGVLLCKLKSYYSKTLVSWLWYFFERKPQSSLYVAVQTERASYCEVIHRQLRGFLSLVGLTASDALFSQTHF